MMSACISLGMILLRYRMRLVDGHLVKPHTAITLRSRLGLQVLLESRLQVG